MMEQRQQQGQGQRREWLAGMAARSAGALVAMLIPAMLAGPAQAEVTKTHSAGFIVRHEAIVKADPKQVWLALISPDKWWRPEHTWSGDSANLLLTPRAGECFCERIPEVDEPDRFTLEGSVEHMRIIQAYPEQALRMRGGLGPLQSEPVNGVLTIAISTVESGTRLVWEYNVAGYMRYEIPIISGAVDGVIGLQSAALADLLGRVDKPQARLPAQPSDDATGVETGPPQPAPTPAPLLPGPSAPAAPPPKKAPTLKVEDAFGDLIGE